MNGAIVQNERQTHSQNTKENSKITTYLSLAPKADLNKETDNRFGFYCNHLENVFNNPDLRNIALIGNRGSGKSSIIRSFDTTKQNSNDADSTNGGAGKASEGADNAGEGVDNAGEGADNPNKKTKGSEGKPKGNPRKFLYISLTDFSGTEQSNTVNAAEIRKKLEYSLLCQILSRCDENDLKNSSIKGIPLDQRKLRPFRYTWFCITMLLVMGLIFENRFGALLAGFGVSTLWRVSLHAVGYIVAFFLSVTGFLYYRRKRPETMRITRLIFKASNVEAEVVPSNDGYCLDRYRFEIVHILDQIADKIDHTVVIEDMERCGNPDVAREIMTRLRELNALVNTHRKGKHQTSNKKKNPDYLPIRFLYALSDDLLGYEERTKFFDTIIPVIPFINKTNSAETIQTILKGKGITIDNDFEKLINGVARSLTDYRLMRNILTEFFLLEKYCKEVCKTTSNYENLENINARIFAVAVYKCFFPREYMQSIADVESAGFVSPSKKKAKELYNFSRMLFGTSKNENQNWLDSNTFNLVFPKDNPPSAVQ